MGNFEGQNIVSVDTEIMLFCFLYFNVSFPDFSTIFAILLDRNQHGGGHKRISRFIFMDEITGNWLVLLFFHFNERNGNGFNCS